MRIDLQSATAFTIREDASFLPLNTRYWAR